MAKRKKIPKDKIVDAVHGPHLGGAQSHGAFKVFIPELNNNDATVDMLDGGINDAPKGTTYEHRVVAFVDFLGFKNLIRQSAKDPNLLASIYNALDVTIDEAAHVYIQELGLDKTPNDFDDRLHTFSDFIVMSVRDDIHEIGLMVHFLHRKCRQLLSLGFACRGGVADGLLLHQNPEKDGSGQKVFGPAFIDAYLLESEHANYPRIIFSNEVRKKIYAYIAGNKDAMLAKFLEVHVRRAEDGPAYLDIFADFSFDFDGFYSKSKDLSMEIEQIKKHLEKMLESSTDSPHIFKKNAYLARLFNRAIEESRCQKVELKVCSSILPAASTAVL